MKKLCKHPKDEGIYRPWTKFLITMKLTAILTLLLFSQAFALKTYSQKTLLNLKLENTSVKEVLKEIEDKSDFYFLYNGDLIDVDRKVSIDVSGKTVQEVLVKLFSEDKVNFLIMDRQIVLSPLTSKASPGAGMQQREITITGNITNTFGEAIPGATVVVQGTNNGTVSDSRGNFILQRVPYEATIIFSFVGMKTQSIPVAGQSVINVVLEEDAIGIEEVVAIGYGTVKKSDVTGAVVSVSAKELTAMPVTNAIQGMQGRAAGVDITSNERPGQMGSVRIRGVRSLNASNDPLYVVDGIPLASGGIEAINPQDIETVDILKDASATAIYGSRGANGVVMITTKRGKSGRMNLNYNGTVTLSSLYDYADYMNSDQYIEYKRNAYRTAGKYPDEPDYAKDFEYFNGAGDPTAWANIEKGWEGGTWDASKVPNTDWGDYVTRTGVTHEHTLSASGGTEKMNAYGSFGYLNQSGTNKGQDYERYSAKIGVEIEPTNWFRLGSDITSSWSIQNYGWTGSGSRAATAIYGAAMGMYPYAEPYDSEGNWIYLPGGFTNVVNPIEEYKNVTDERKTLRLLGSFFAEVKLFDGLKYRINFGPDFRQYRQGVFRTAASILQGTGNGVNYASATTSQNFSYTLDNLIYYDKTFGSHDIGITLLQTASESRFEEYAMTAEDLEWDEQKWYAFGLNDLKSKSSAFRKTALTSYMARANYSYADKYLLTVSGRWDGASQLADGHKWDFFPSAAFGWRMEQEPFLQEIAWIDQLKLRAGVGTTGNSAIEAYGTQGAVAHTFYSFYNVYESGYYASDYMLQSPPKMANKTLGWEKTTQYNVGFDFLILNSRINGTLDLYKSKTKDLLMNMTILSLTGYTSTYANVGKTSNKGVDITLSTRNIETKDFKWSTDLTFAVNRAKIEELSNGKEDDITNLWFIGEDLNVAYDYEKIGIWQTADADEMAKYNANGHTYKAGDVKVRDLSDDDKIDANKDRKVLGSYNPKWIGGMTNTFNYKDFELSFFIYARWGFLMDGGAADMQGLYQSRDIDYWRPDNPTNDYPIADYNNGGQPEYYSSMNYQDGSFIKMRNISLGYNLPKPLASSLGIASAKVFVQAINPFMIYSKCKFLDGDLSNGYIKDDSASFNGTSISSKSWVFGLSVAF
jgi:TonB-linked SusC/RagA family outer membrane protein